MPDLYPVFDMPGFQPTYEGLKRNNQVVWTANPATFPAYLRGIETRVGGVSLLRAIRVSSLPTRD